MKLSALGIRGLLNGHRIGRRARTRRRALSTGLPTAAEVLEIRTLLSAPHPVDLSTLDGTNGFRLDGIDRDGVSGYSVSSAGDVNGDGFDDVIIGAHLTDDGGVDRVGKAFVVFGAAGGFPASQPLSALDGTNGFQLLGLDERDVLGFTVSSAGDVNGDGFDDLIVGAPGGDPNGSGSGETYLVFGKPAGFPATLDPSTLDGANGFQLNGIDADDRSGWSVSGAGDVNGDGFDDLILGAMYADPGGRAYAGASYVVFGKSGGFPSQFELSTLNGTNGFRMDGLNEGDRLGGSVSSAGDVNGDGFDDLIIGPYGRDNQSEKAYVVFGAKSGFAPVLDLATLDGTNGFRMDATDTRDAFAFSVSAAGDVNGDGFDDVILGAYLTDPGGLVDAGESYVVFGAAGGFAPVFDVATLDGTNGFALAGVDGGDFSGLNVSGAGDVNGDGFDDLIIGANRARKGGIGNVGETYVIFGKPSGFAAAFELSSLNGTNGFRLDGIDAGDRSGSGVSGAGDVNGDGFDDLIIGAHFGGSGALVDAGETYVVFGGNFTGGVETQVGDGGANVLIADQGAAVVDVLVGGRGNDTLISDGGDDVLRGGEGDDLLAIPDANFSPRRLQGGNGIDTLRLDGSGITLDLTTIADNRIVDIEQIDLRGSGANTLTLDVLEVLNISTHSNTLVVRANGDDTVNMGSGWSRQANETLSGETFEVFSKGAAVLKVEAVAATTRGVSDVIGRNAETGTVAVGVSIGNGFATRAAGVVPAGADWSELVAGDFNGDGVTDLAGLSPSDGQWRVLLATPDGFSDPQIWGQWSTNVSFSDIVVGDFNADGRDDVAGRANTGTWVVGLSDGTQFATSGFGAWSTTAGFGNVQTGDFNGDGRADIAGLAANGRWVVGLSDSSRFAMSSFGIWSTTAGFGNILTGDFNGDGRTDIAALSASGKWVVGLSDGSRFAFSVFAQWSTTAGFGNIRVGDFNGDGRSDIAALAANGTWVVGLSEGDRFALSAFGMWSTAAGFDNIVVGDFDGDGNADIAGLSDSGKWVVALSDGTRFTNDLFTTWSSTALWDNITAGHFA